MSFMFGCSQHDRKDGDLVCSYSSFTAETALQLVFFRGLMYRNS